MRKKGFAPVIITAILTVVGVLGYFIFKYLLLSKQTSTLEQPYYSPSPISSIITSNVIDQWIPQVKWDSPKTGSYRIGWLEQPKNGVIRKGNILNSDLNPIWFSDVESKILKLGWEKQLPIGASGPNLIIATYAKDINGVKKVLVITSEVTEDLANKEPPYTNVITVFQEQ